jgi:hypothetical protein
LQKLPRSARKKRREAPRRAVCVPDPQPCGNGAFDDDVVAVLGAMMRGAEDNETIEIAVSYGRAGES